jgi:hypothetical protein
MKIKCHPYPPRNVPCTHDHADVHWGAHYLWLVRDNLVFIFKMRCNYIIPNCASTISPSFCIGANVLGSEKVSKPVAIGFIDRHTTVHSPSNSSVALRILGDTVIPNNYYEYMSWGVQFQIRLFINKLLCLSKRVIRDRQSLHTGEGNDYRKKLYFLSSDYIPAVRNVIDVNTRPIP